MIPLTRLSGSVFALNADLIERIDSTPDTVITLVDGKKYVVADPLREVMSAIVRHRAEVVALSSHIHVDDVRLPRDPHDPHGTHDAPGHQALASLLDLHQARPALSVVEPDQPAERSTSITEEVSPR